MGTHFRAPWGIKLWVTTLGFIALFVFIAVRSGPPVAQALLVVAIIASSFMVRGYSVTQDKILVHRLGWSTKFELDDVVDAFASPGATMGSIRVMGVGGLFGFIGRFRNETLGLYRAYATDSDNAVVVDLGESKLVVTPDDPVKFVAAIDAARA